MGRKEKPPADLSDCPGIRLNDDGDPVAEFETLAHSAGPMLDADTDTTDEE